MRIRESNLIEICKKHGFVYNIIISDHTKPARQALVNCRCDEFDASLEAKSEGYECKVTHCKNKCECIFSKNLESGYMKAKRPILVKFTRRNKKVYGCIHYNWNGEDLNEDK